MDSAGELKTIWVFNVLMRQTSVGGDKTPSIRQEKMKQIRVDSDSYPPLPNFVKLLREVFAITPKLNVFIYYEDNEKDLIRVSNDSEWSSHLHSVRKQNGAVNVNVLFSPKHHYKANLFDPIDFSKYDFSSNPVRVVRNPKKADAPAGNAEQDTPGQDTPDVAGGEEQTMGEASAKMPQSDSSHHVSLESAIGDRSQPVVFTPNRLSDLAKEAESPHAETPSEQPKEPGPDTIQSNSCVSDNVVENEEPMEDAPVPEVCDTSDQSQGEGMRDESEPGLYLTAAELQQLRETICAQVRSEMMKHIEQCVPLAVDAALAGITPRGSPGVNPPPVQAPRQSPVLTFSGPSLQSIASSSVSLACSSLNKMAHQVDPVAHQFEKAVLKPAAQSAYAMSMEVAKSLGHQMGIRNVTHQGKVISKPPPVPTAEVDVSKLNCSFVSHGQLDGKYFGMPGLGFVPKWNVRNNGEVDWPVNLSVRLANPLGAQVTVAGSDVPPLKVGEEGVVSVDLLMLGKESSYKFLFELSFNHRNFGDVLPCEVTVVSSEPKAPQASNSAETPQKTISPPTLKQLAEEGEKELRKKEESRESSCMSETLKTATANDDGDDTDVESDASLDDFTVIPLPDCFDLTKAPSFTSSFYEDLKTPKPPASHDHSYSEPMDLTRTADKRAEIDEPDLSPKGVSVEEGQYFQQRCEDVSPRVEPGNDSMPMHVEDNEDFLMVNKAETPEKSGGEQSEPIRPVSCKDEQRMMEQLLSLGFGDRALNRKLLAKHNYQVRNAIEELISLQ